VAGCLPSPLALFHEANRILDYVLLGLISIVGDDLLLLQGRLHGAGQLLAALRTVWLLEPAEMLMILEADVLVATVEAHAEASTQNDLRQLVQSPNQGLELLSRPLLDVGVGCFVFHRWHRCFHPSEFFMIRRSNSDFVASLSSSKST